MKAILVSVLFTLQLFSSGGEVIGDNIKKLYRNDGKTPQKYPEPRDRELNVLRKAGTGGKSSYFRMKEKLGKVTAQGFGYVPEKVEKSLAEEKGVNFSREYRAKKIFVGEYGEYSYKDLKGYGEFIESRYPDTKRKFRKYRDYERFLDFYRELFPKFYIETDILFPEIEIDGVKNFKQGMALERDKTYYITIRGRDGTRAFKKVEFTGQKILIK
jgi:hypothetical protein